MFCNSHANLSSVKAEKTRKTLLKIEYADYSEALLDAKVRLGELFEDIPAKQGGGRQSENFKADSTLGFEKSNGKNLTFSKTSLTCLLNFLFAFLLSFRAGCILFMWYIEKI